MKTNQIPNLMGIAMCAKSNNLTFYIKKLLNGGQDEWKLIRRKQ